MTGWEDYKVEPRSTKPIEEKIERDFKSNLEEFGLEFAQGYRKAQRELLLGKNG